MFGFPCGYQSGGGKEDMGRKPHKLSLIEADGNPPRLKTFRDRDDAYLRVKNSASKTRVIIQKDECPSWFSEGDMVIADRMDGTDVAESLVDGTVDEVNVGKSIKAGRASAVELVCEK